MEKENSMNTGTKNKYVPPTITITRVVLEGALLQSPVCEFDYVGPEWIEGGEVGAPDGDGSITLW